MSKAKISQRDINNAAWAACDTFRGVVDPGQYKDYILAMLFVKYISDVWQDHYESYREKHGDDEIRIHRKMARERFMLPEVLIRDHVTNDVTDQFRATFRSLYERRNAANIGQLINNVLDAIESANVAKLEGVFRNIDFNSEINLGKTRDRNRRLRLLLEDFNKPLLDMRPSRVSEDVIGNTYIYLIERFAADAGKKAGEFYTPQKVSHLVAKLARPVPGDCICDPACGSGGLLIEAASEVGSHNYALFGMEVNGGTWALARMNMFLHGADSARIEWCNALTSPTLIENDRLMEFDVVVANPPFSLDKWGAEEAEVDRYNRFWRGVPPKSKGDWAFISHMIETAKKEKGRIVVVVPHGVLFRGGAEGRIRQAVVDANLVDAVISLPSNLFPTTSIPISVLVFDRSRENGGENADRSDILFIDASRDFVSGKNQNTLNSDHLRKIIETYESRVSRDKYAYLAPLQEVRENEYNLNIPRYVDVFEDDEDIDIEFIEEEIKILESELDDVRNKMSELLKGLKHTN